MRIARGAGRAFVLGYDRVFHVEADQDGMGFWCWSPPTFGVGKGRFPGHPVLGWRRVSVPWDWAMGRCKILMLVSQLSCYSGGGVTAVEQDTDASQLSCYSVELRVLGWRGCSGRLSRSSSIDGHCLDMLDM
jgi:hypothetical protein